MFSTYETTSMASEMALGYNYGSLEISDKDTKFRAFVRDINGKNFFERNFAGADLSYNKSNLNNEKLCIAQADKQLYFRLILQKLDEIILKGDLDTAVRLILIIPALLLTLLALALRITEFVLRICGLSLSRLSAAK